jgi:hypothetical protein
LQNRKKSPTTTTASNNKIKKPCDHRHRRRRRRPRHRHRHRHHDHHHHDHHHHHHDHQHDDDDDQKDIHRASLLFKKAAESGHAPSQYYLGVIFLYGQGGFPRDYDMAFYWMDRAARGKASRDTADAAARALGELRVVLSNSTTRMDALSRRFRVGPRGGPEDSETLFTALDADADGRVSREEFGAKWHRPPAQVGLWVGVRVRVRGWAGVILVVVVAVAVVAWWWWWWWWWWWVCW